MILRNLSTAAALLGCLFCAATAAAHEATSKGVTVAHPWVRATPGGVTVGAAYFEVRTDKGVRDTLIGATAEVATAAELHTHVMEKGVARMRRVETVALAAGSSLVFAPSGYHVMLIGLKQPLKEGDLVKLSLLFEKAGAIEVEASVEPVGAKGPHGFDHQPGHDPKAAAKGKSGGGHNH